LTAEQLEAARAERMRQNGHGAITIEDVRTWIEETGLCIFLPRSAQAGFTAPTFLEAVAGQRTIEPTLELIASAESLLVRLEAEGVAVRLNLAGQSHNQSGDQPDYVVAGWVLPYIYALRGDRDWRRSPQLTGSRQVSQLAVQAAKQLDSANLTATQIRDLLGRETTEAAVLRALHELWKQLRIIPVVPEVGAPALWQPLRQRFQKAIAEGASTSQVTAISVLASIYLQAVIAASMEDVEMFLSPLTSRSKIREVVRGLAATRQVHSTSMGHSPMYYVAGTLPEFPAVPSFQINSSLPSHRSSNYRSSAYLDPHLDHEEEEADSVVEIPASVIDIPLQVAAVASSSSQAPQAAPRRKPVARPAAAAGISSGKSAPPRPRSGRNSSSVHPRERSHGGSGEARSNAGNDRRRAPAPRNASSNGNGGHNTGVPAAGRGNSGNGNGHHANGNNGSHHAKPGGPVKNGASKTSQATSHSASRTSWGTHAKGATNGAKPSSSGTRPGARTTARPTARPNARPDNRLANRPKAGANGHPASSKGAGHGPANGANGSGGALKNGSSNGARNGGSRSLSKPGARPAARPRNSSDAVKRGPVAASASKRLSFSGQAKQAPKPAAKRTGTPARAAASSRLRPGSKPAPAAARTGRPAESKRRG
jgi:23S rRNA pseudouridine2605 synthase